MTAENFSYYLKNPGHLYQVSYQELKSLVVQYPYCQNLRFLLVTKSQLENSEEYQKDLALAATYHVDRSYLHHLINQEKNKESSESFVLQEDYLELKDLSTTQIEQNEVPQASFMLDHQEEISAQEESFELPNIEASAQTYLTESIIPQESINEPSNDEANEEVIDHMELTESDDSETSISSPPQDLAEEEAADNISDESELISYMEKPKNSKSVIEQLLKKGKTKATKKEKKQQQKNIAPPSEKPSNLEDELESPPTEEENDFKDLTPIKETPRFGKEVLFEITNKTEKEMDALLHKANQPEEELIDEQLGYLDSKEETKEEDSVKPLEGSTPAPKTTFKSYVDQFQPPTEFLEDLEKEDELANAINEALEEENDEVGIMMIRMKKSKKKKKKLMSKLKMKKKEKID